VHCKLSNIFYERYQWSVWLKRINEILMKILGGLMGAWSKPFHFLPWHNCSKAVLRTFPFTRVSAIELNRRRWWQILLFWQILTAVSNISVERGLVSGDRNSTFGHFGYLWYLCSAVESRRSAARQHLTWWKKHPQTREDNEAQPLVPPLA